MLRLALIICLLMVGCAAPVRDICATGLDTWVDGGYGVVQGESVTTGETGETLDESDAWDVRAGFNVHWDLTGSCWEYEDEGKESYNPGMKPGDPHR